MLFGMYPWKPKNRGDLYEKVRTKSGLDLPFPANVEISPQLKNMLQLMIYPDPNKRMDWSKLFEFTDVLMSTVPQQFLASRAVVDA